MKYENSRYKWLYRIIPHIVYFLMNLKFSENSMFDGISSIDQDFEDLALDIAIKLKKEYSDDPVSDLFAASYDLQKIARISDLDDSLFHFKFYRKNLQSQKSMNKSHFNLMIHEKRDKIRFKRFIHDKIQNIRNDDRVEYVHTQTYLVRNKRRHVKNELLNIIDEILKESLDKKLESEIYAKRNIQKQFNNEIIFNDKNYDKQWYLINDGKMNLSRVHDINVKEGWIKGFSGKNVSIVVIDDGLDYEHPDFRGKYRADLSYDLNDENDPNHDPMPATFDNQNNHGTKCAGVAAAIGNNSVCGVGVAFNAQIGAIRVLDGPITDLIEARALSYMSKFVDIKSASWGPRDDGAHMEYPGYFVNLALEDGIKNGRNGKGTLYVWASGNGGGNDDDCSCDGYASHWNIISIGSINHKGLTPYFMELCPSTMAVVYSGGQNNINGDEDDPGVRVVASDVRGKCTTTFQGTSSAAPLAAGALALVLEANPNLTYRDVMHLITKTARIPNLEDISGWIVNGGRFHINEKYGFGVLDVALMIQEAQNWNYVAERMKCEVEYMGDFNQLKPGSKSTIKISGQSCITLDKLEHVVANISFEYSIRGNVKLTLISPHGTPSEILSFRKNDKSKKGIRNFPFMTLFNWGENPRGTWKLIIETKNDSSNSIGKLQHFSLILYGTKQTFKRLMEQRYKDFKHMAFFPDKMTIQKIYERELIQSREIKISRKKY